MSSLSKRGRPAYPDLLTPVEWRVVDGIRHGMSGRQIARGRGVSPDAVKYHVRNVLAKLQLESREDLRRWPGVPAASALGRKEQATTMNDSLSLGPIGQISLEVEDVDRAVEFYKTALGMTHLYSFPSPVGTLAFFDCGGTRLFLSHHEDGQAGGSSVLYFRVDDILGAHRTLESRGVTFDGAPHMIHRHEDGTEEWMAFFKDSEDNLLALMSQVRPPASA
jgi:predicted enzyme related to lactoylglutathione lyase/DNA-binding CsgD family transcriptional regulator